MAVASLKEGPCIDFINHLIEQTGAMLVINTTSFAVNRNGDQVDAEELPADLQNSLFVG